MVSSSSISSISLSSLGIVSLIYPQTTQKWQIAQQAYSTVLCRLDCLQEMNLESCHKFHYKIHPIGSSRLLCLSFHFNCESPIYEICITLYQILVHPTIWLRILAVSNCDTTVLLLLLNRLLFYAKPIVEFFFLISFYILIASKEYDESSYSIQPSLYDIAHHHTIIRLCLLGKASLGLFAFDYFNVFWIDCHEKTFAFGTVIFLTGLYLFAPICAGYHLKDFNTFEEVYWIIAAIVFSLALLLTIPLYHLVGIVEIDNEIISTSNYSLNLTDLHKRYFR